MSFRIIYMGTPSFAVPTLEALDSSSHDVVACYTRAPKPAGRRGLQLTSTPVHLTAEKLGIPIFHPSSFSSSEVQNEFASHACDLAIVVAYGLLLPKQILESPKLGCYNGHASLLPRWRGAAPIQRAIMSGDTETGISIMKMDEGLDTGAYALQSSIPIHITTDAQTLHNDLSHLCAKTMLDAINQLEQGNLPLTPQSQEGVSYANKIDKSESRINWQHSNFDIHRQIMGLSSDIGAWCEIDGERIKVFKSECVDDELNESNDLVVKCAEGSIKILELQKSGGKRISSIDFLNGYSGSGKIT